MLLWSVGFYFACFYSFFLLLGDRLITRFMWGMEELRGGEGKEGAAMNDLWMLREDVGENLREMCFCTCSRDWILGWIPRQGSQGVLDSESKF